MFQWCLHRRIPHMAIFHVVFYFNLKLKRILTTLTLRTYIVIMESLLLMDDDDMFVVL